MLWVGSFVWHWRRVLFVRSTQQHSVGVHFDNPSATPLSVETVETQLPLLFCM